MIKIIKGTFSTKGYGPGTILNLDEETEIRLIRLQMAEKIELPEDENIFLSSEEIKKIRSKGELQAYAQSIKMDADFSKMKLIQMKEEILNYQEEIQDHVRKSPELVQKG